MNLQDMRFDKSNFLRFFKKKGTSSPGVRRPTRSAATRRRRLEVTEKSGNGECVTFDHDRHFFSDAIELTEMQHFSFYKFKKLPASICLGIWDQIVKVVR